MQNVVVIIMLLVVIMHATLIGPALLSCGGRTSGQFCSLLKNLTWEAGYWEILCCVTVKSLMLMLFSILLAFIGRNYRIRAARNPSLRSELAVLVWNT